MYSPGSSSGSQFLRLHQLCLLVSITFALPACSRASEEGFSTMQLSTELRELARRLGWSHKNQLLQIDEERFQVYGLTVAWHLVWPASGESRVSGPNCSLHWGHIHLKYMTCSCLSSKQAMSCARPRCCTQAPGARPQRPLAGGAPEGAAVRAEWQRAERVWAWGKRVDSKQQLTHASTPTPVKARSSAAACGFPRASLTGGDRGWRGRRGATAAVSIQYLCSRPQSAMGPPVGRHRRLLRRLAMLHERAEQLPATPAAALCSRA